MRTLTLILAIQCVFAPALCAQSLSADTTPRLRVLFIGNSYTLFNEYPRLFQMLSISAEVNNLPEIHSAVIPGARLRTHWEDSLSRAAIQRGRWNFVILQTQSQETLTQPDSTLKYARLLSDEIRSTGGKPLLVQHWSRMNEPENGAALRASIERVAAALNVPIVPIGTAFELVRQRAPTIELYHADNSHPTQLGSYLAACVVFAFVYGKSPAGLLPYTFETTYHSTTSWDTAVRRIEIPVARLIQDIAWEVVSVQRGR
jgi:hypothetical protein